MLEKWFNITSPSALIHLAIALLSLCAQTHLVCTSACSCVCVQRTDAVSCSWSIFPACLAEEIHSVYMNAGYQTNFHSFIVGDLLSFSPSLFLSLSPSFSLSHTYMHTHRHMRKAGKRRYSLDHTDFIHREGQKVCALQWFIVGTFIPSALKVCLCW